MQDSQALRCRFLFADPAADDVFRRSLADDIRASRLTPAFRAYYSIRRLLPISMRQFLQRQRRLEVTSDWYAPSDFLSSLAKAIESGPSEHCLVHPWPAPAEFAFVLTHDVETAEGQRRVAQIADMEQALGFRSSWNFVPYKYPVDQGLLAELRDRGFEIGVHGYNHDGRLFSSRAEFDRRVPAINEALRSWGAVGFRAPMVHRNLDWMQALEIAYDASCFDVDPYQAMPGGVGGIWPFIVGRFVELPYTLPQDHTLFVTRDETDGRIWHEKLRRIVDWHGMSLVITHPDYLDSAGRVEAYRRLLCHARELPGIWHALPREVAAWWRIRDESVVHADPAGDRHISGPAAAQGRPVVVQIQWRGSASSPLPVASLAWHTPSSASTPRALDVCPS